MSWHWRRRSPGPACPACATSCRRMPRSGVHVDPLRFDQAALEAVMSHAWDTAAGDGDARARGGDSRLLRRRVRPGPRRGRGFRRRARRRRDRAPRRRPLPRLHARVPARLRLPRQRGRASIAMPRRATPRTDGTGRERGHRRTHRPGVYPCESPGGWRLIGRTPPSMFDLTRPEPALLAPGDSRALRAAGARPLDGPARRDGARTDGVASRPADDRAGPRPLGPSGGWRAGGWRRWTRIRCASPTRSSAMPGRRPRSR